MAAAVDIMSRAWFLAGTATRLTDVAGAAEFLAGGECRFAFIEARQERGFAEQAGLGCAMPGPRIEAINISNGQATPWRSSVRKACCERGRRLATCGEAGPAGARVPATSGNGSLAGRRPAIAARAPPARRAVLARHHRRHHGVLDAPMIIAVGVPECRGLFNELTGFGTWVGSWSRSARAADHRGTRLAGAVAFEPIGPGGLRCGSIFPRSRCPGCSSPSSWLIGGRGRSSAAMPTRFSYMPFIWKPEYASLPSGHATNVFAALVVGLVWPRSRPSC
jgi:membrane-associated phospholipid phosphatase